MNDSILLGEIFLFPIMLCFSRRFIHLCLSPDRVHQPFRLDESGRVDFMPFPLLGHTFAKGFGDLGVGPFLA